MQFKNSTSSFKIFCNGTKNICPKKRSEQKEVSSEGGNLVKLLQEEITYLRDKNKVKSEIIRMLSDKQNTSLNLHTNAAVRQTKHFSLFANKELHYNTLYIFLKVININSFMTEASVI